MSYFISMKSRSTGSYSSVTITSDLDDTLMDSKELYLLKDELEEVLEEVNSLLPEEAEYESD